MAREVQAFYFTEEDVALFKGLLAEAKQRRNLRSSRPNEEIGQSPDSYIALVPEDGIPALSSMGTFSDQPGFAICDIYTIQNQDTDSPELVALNFQAKVFNLSTGEISGDSWVLIHRDKFGSWIAGVKFSGTGGGVEVRRYNNSNVLTNTFTDITRIDVYSSTGIDVSELSGHIELRGLEANTVLAAYQWGVMTDQDQNFWGEKTFQYLLHATGGVEIDGGGTITNGLYKFDRGPGPSYFPGYILTNSGIGGSTPYVGPVVIDDYMAYCDRMFGWQSQVGANYVRCTLWAGGGASQTSECLFMLWGECPDDGVTHPSYGGSTYKRPRYAIFHDGSGYYGETTTNGQFKGGIYVGPTSGPSTVLADGDYTGVTVSGSGTIIEVNDGTITTPKLADVIDLNNP